jgi:hypothetical protein
MNVSMTEEEPTHCLVFVFPVSPSSSGTVGYILRDKDYYLIGTS